MNKNPNDQFYMAEALRNAAKGLYTTRTNPRVGCVIVKDGELIAHGHHQSPGNPHAEINALSSIANSTNATVYVSLEPCSHYGKTPPCAEALVAAKVARVVAAMHDPNPLVNGEGLAYLQEHGIKTDSHVLENEALELNKGFVKRMTTNRPYITVKSAISLDGKTALKSGESKWISSDASRIDVQKLRARSCAIMTGIETVIADDPNLTVRLSKEELSIETQLTQPKRVVLDTRLRISSKAKILKHAEEVIIYTCATDNEKISKLKKLKAEVVSADLINDNVDLEFVMKDLGKRGINEILVEAGSTLVGSLLERQLVDEMVVYMAPHIMGDASHGLAKLGSIQSMQDRIELDVVQTRTIGNDFKITLKPKFT